MTDATPLPLIERPLPGARATWPGRRAALAELEVAGWPQKRQERWRYTDLEPLRRDDFVTAPPPGDTERRTAGALLARAAGTAPRLAFVDGHFCSELSSALPAGLEALDLDARWSEFEGRWAGHVATKDYPLAALNTAFGQHGLWLRVAPGCVVDAAVHVVHVGSSRERLAAQPRLVIEVGERARITLIEQIVDAGAGSGWMNSVVQLRQAAGSHVDLYRFQRHGERQAHTSLLAADLATDAQLTAGYVDLGSRLARNDVDITLRERGACTELFGLFVPGPGQHIDNHTTIVHAAPETRSDETFRGVIGERGHGVFNGKVVVRPKAQRIDARQSNDNLLLGEHCEIDTKPELEIYADDVKCSHGSTVGELDTDQLFYLRARGIDVADAREMLTSAFAASVLERVRDAAFRETVLDLVTARLRTLAEEPT